MASLTWAHTVNGSERLLVVGVSFNPGAGRNVSSVTYNGAAMTAAGNRAGSNDEIAIYYLVNPDLGTNNVVVTFNTSVTEAVAGAISLTGVDQAAPIGTFASNTTSSSNASVSVTGLANGIIVDTVAWSYAPTPTGGPTTGQTQAWKGEAEQCVGRREHESRERCNYHGMGFQWQYRMGDRCFARARLNRAARRRANDDAQWQLTDGQGAR